MRATFIVLITDKSGEGPNKELENISRKILDELKYWRLEKFNILSNDSLESSH